MNLKRNIILTNWQPKIPPIVLAISQIKHVKRIAFPVLASAWIDYGLIASRV